MGSEESWESPVRFRRPVFDEIAHGIDSLEQIISVTGPRRVGKSTLLKQIVSYLISEKSVDPDLIVYYSFDDPTLYRAEMSGGEMFESLMSQMVDSGTPDKPIYFFLDEIQTLERWEQYLKKYFDLKYPFKFIISGSASSPIFKRSRESLLGRVKDFHLLPFSFKEYLLFRAHNESRSDIIKEVGEQSKRGAEVRGMIVNNPEYLETESVGLLRLPKKLWEYCEGHLSHYIVEGGFPEVWRMQSQDQKIDYLFDNQVKKVIMEDLVLAVELRKPELLKTFYISLLEKPGREVNKTRLSQELGIGVRQIDKYLPLLEMTDLVRSANKFRRSSQRVRSGNQKFYPVDMALRNAVLRIGKEILKDDAALGLYAETFVFNALKKWGGVLSIDFYRNSKQEEVDFIVHAGPNKFLPVEVKYASLWRPGDIKAMKKFYEKHSSEVPRGIVVTKDRKEFGKLSSFKNTDDLAYDPFCIPLVQFLLMFD